MMTPDRTSEKAMNIAAVGFAGSPYWLPSLHDLSAWCADALPIAGFLWLLIQVSFKIYDRWKIHKEE